MILELKAQISKWRTKRSRRAFPAWLVSVGVHGLLSICLLSTVQRSGLPDGSGTDPVDTALNLMSSFSTEEAPSDGGAGFELTGRSTTGGEVKLADPGAATAQVLPTVTTDEPVATVEAEFVPAPDTVPENEPAVLERPADPEELLASAFPQVKPIRNVSAQPAAADSDAASEESSGEGEGVGGEGNAGEGIAGKGGRGGGNARFGSPDGTSFFQINAQGQHFCYVVDCSNSMEDGNAIEMARRELRASLLRLDASKKFQILFYDAEVHQLMNDGESILQATDTNRRLARQFSNSQQPTGRALHKTALMTALRSKPDVIFFLTDGEVPELSARDLADLKSTNRRRTQINVVEFGNGAKLERNWLEQLARDHRGNYRYRDIEAAAAE